MLSGETANTLPVSNQQALTAPLDTSIGEIAGDIDRLRKRRALEVQNKQPVSSITKELAAELDTKLKGLSTAVKSSKLAEAVNYAFKAHRAISGLLSTYTKRVDDERSFCSQVMLTFQREEQARAAAERRRLEEEQRKALEAQRAEEAVHLKALGEAEAAKIVEATPVNVSVQVEPEKVQGVSISSYWTVGDVTDPIAFAKWLIENPHHFDGVEMKLSKIYFKTFLNKRTGSTNPTIPGVEVVSSGTTTNRNAA